MGDVSFYGGGRRKSVAAGAVSYNELSNRPIINVAGYPVILIELPTGIYNISGTWAAISDSEAFESPADDLFYIVNSGDGFKAVRISAEGVYTISYSEASGVVYDTIASVGDAVEQVKESLWGEM
jgi:hypothetical protein